MNWNKNDTKAFFIGMIASASAVVLWDVVKKSLGIFNYEVKKSTPLLDKVEDGIDKLKGGK